MTAAATVSAAIQAAGYSACTDSPNVDLRSAWTVGKSEQERIAAGDMGIKDGANDEGDEAYGFAVRYYAENFNSTEFGFYYQKADSRLPYISFNSGKQTITGASTTYKASNVARGAAAVGLGGLAGLGAIHQQGALYYNPAYNAITVNDPDGIMAALSPVAQGFYDAAGNGYTMSSTAGTIARFQEVNAALIAGQIDSTITTGGALGLDCTDPAIALACAYDSAGQLPTGSTFLGFNHGLSLFAEHPEIETWGFSFNTNIGGHTVQGDFNYRPDMPLQIDTDVLTINALFNGCAFTSVGIFEGAYQGMSTLGNERGSYNTNPTGAELASPVALATGADSAIGCRRLLYPGLGRGI